MTSPQIPLSGRETAAGDHATIPRVAGAAGAHTPAGQGPRVADDLSQWIAIGGAMGCYESHDGGKTWRQISGPLADARADASEGEAAGGLDPHDQRLAQYGHTLDRDNVRHVCEHIDRYPEIIAAARAAQPPQDTGRAMPTCTDPECPIYARHRAQGRTFPPHGPHDFRAAIAGGTQ